ncbi:MAG: 30S ribosomal protein S26e [Candidatus Bathyarchaeia archaeon]
MPKKRSSRGRSKGGKGASGLVQCDNCGALVPRDKAKHVTRFVSLVDRTLAKELRSQGAQIASQKVVKTYCVSCAVHHGVVKVRAKAERRRF